MKTLKKVSSLLVLIAVLFLFQQCNTTEVEDIEVENIEVEEQQLIDVNKSMTPNGSLQKDNSLKVNSEIDFIYLDNFNQVARANDGTNYDDPDGDEIELELDFNVYNVSYSDEIPSSEITQFRNIYVNEPVEYYEMGETVNNIMQEVWYIIDDIDFTYDPSSPPCENCIITIRRADNPNDEIDIDFHNLTPVIINECARK